MSGTPATPEAYLARLPDVQRRTLSNLRGEIRAYLPEAEECMSYGMPGFRQGRMVAGYAAFKHHMGYYPHSGGIVSQMTELLSDWKTSKSGVLFTPETPLPRDILHRLIDLRLAEIAAMPATPKGH